MNQVAPEPRKGSFARAIFGLAFLVAGTLKAIDPATFAITIGAYGLLPETAVTPAAILIPWVEIGAALALLFVPKLREAGAVVLLMLLVLFSAAMIAGLAMERIVPCGCFGGWIRMLETPGWALARNALLFALGVRVFLRVSPSTAS